MKNIILLVGGGNGKRMGSDVPKQFLEVNKIPIWVYTVQKFNTWNPDCQIVIVLPEDFISLFTSQAKIFCPDVPFIICAGGKERTDSVKNGLLALQHENQNAWVWIHDLVRPLVSLKTLQNLSELAENKGNAVASVPVKSSLRMIQDSGSIAVDRSKFMEVQTPQVFKLNEIIAAYKTINQNFTDDASLMEYLGYSINLAEGNYENIKITSPEDLFVMERMLKVD